MEKLRRERGFSKAEVARRARLQANVVGWVESGRFLPYKVQLEHIAEALDYEGDPADLLEEVEG